MRSHTEYAGMYVIDSREHPGCYLISDAPEGGCNIAPGATYFKSREDALQAIDILKVVDGDGQKFWHLLRAIDRGRPPETRELELLRELAQYGERSDAEGYRECPHCAAHGWGWLEHTKECPLREARVLLGQCPHGYFNHCTSEPNDEEAN